MKNKYLMSSLFLLICLFTSCTGNKKNDRVLDVSGKWAVQLDSADIGLQQGWNKVSFEQTITLPGTTDDAGLGIADTLSPNLQMPQLAHLARKHSFLGAAWYTRELTIPNDWKGKDIVLKLERAMWKTNVWVDGVEVEGSQNSLTTPHYCNLTKYLTTGKHRLTIKVDNRKQVEMSVDNMAHSYTNETQIIWNGVIGQMQLEALDPIHIEQVKITPNIETKKVMVTVAIENSTTKNQKGDLMLSANLKNKPLSNISKAIDIPTGKSVVSMEYAMPNNVQLWSEFSPIIYQMQAQLKAGENESTKTETFGMRKISRKGSVLTINDQALFLRGTLECCIFPLTGHPPMDKAGWQKVFSTAKAWGLNHIRFHSWCPPEEAFEVADEMGFYLQIELPEWILNVGEHQATTDFMYQEADRIINEYGNHPSFCFWSMGNELQGNMSVLAKMVVDLKAKDDRHLYTTTSFTFEKGYGASPQPEDDYLVTQWTKHGWVRGQGIFNSEPPSFDKNYSKAVDSITVPIITHEIGQYAVYPNMDEIAKYTGVLKPLNFISIREDLKKKGLLDKAPAFTQASGQLAVILYKEEIERAMKTGGISGFQLLDLHDFPGQGTALVGLLDAFWDNKGFITPQKFSEFCAPVVPLICFPKATYTNDEQFEGTIDVSNYSNKEFKNQTITWSLLNATQAIASGSSIADVNSGYNHNLADLKIDLSKITTATKLTVQVALKGTSYQNSWNIWVYPKDQTINFGDVKYTRDLNQALTLLKEGKKVLLNPDWKKVKGIEGKFVPVFWSPVHFPKQAGTMGLLCDPKEKVFQDFPTDNHTDWQWWDLNINSTTLIVDSIVGGHSLVQMIDNFANNRRLSSLYEGKIGSGRLMIASFDLNTDLDKRPVAKQMLVSILKYMNSSDFDPSEIKNPESLKGVLASQQNAKKESAKGIY